jgi:uncharacterized protein YegP (UPF0339 family)
MSKLEVYKRADGKWAWTLHADNGDVIANDGSQGYENKLDCVGMGQRIISGEFSVARTVFS